MKEKPDTLWGKAYILVSVANFFSWLSYNMVTPVLTGYLKTLGGSVFVCGVAAGLFAFTSLLSRPVSGLLVDALNKKKLLYIFTLLMGASLFLYSIIPSIPVILLFRGLHGIAFGISSTASLVLVSECVSEARIGEAVSYFGIMSVASMAIGPAIGIWLSDSYGYRVCMLVSTAMLFVAAFIAAMFPYIHRKSEIEFRITDVFSVPRIVEQKLIGLSGVNASFTMMNGIVSTYLVVFAAERGIHGSSWHFTVNAVVLILTRILMARKMNQWSLKQNLYPAFIFGIVTLLLIGWANSLLLLIIAAAAKAMAQSMSQPALQTEALRRVIPEKRGVACSTMYIGGDLGQAVGPILGGLLAQNFGYGNMYFASVIPLVFACIYFVMWSRSSR